MPRRTPKLSYWREAPMPRCQLTLFPTTLEDRIPANHSVRLLDEILEEMNWTGWEAQYVGDRGQPPIHPKVPCKVILYGLIRKIRSSRQLEYAVGHSIDFIWLASGHSLDHTTLSEFRRKHKTELKGLYTQTIKTAVALGIAKLHELVIDGTKIQANASRHKTLRRADVEKLLEEQEAQIEQALAQMESADQLDELFEDDQPTEALPTELSDLVQRRAKLQEVLDKLKHMEELRRLDGIDNSQNPAQLPITDPDSRILPNKSGGYAANYTPIVVTETTSGLIVADEVVIGNVEHTHVVPLIEDIEATYQSHTDVLLGDGAFSTGPNLAAAEQRGTELISPVRQEVTRADNPAYRDDLTKPVAEEDIKRLPLNPSTKRFDRSAFVYSEKDDTYHCPAGKVLKREGTVERTFTGGVEIERSNYRCYDCKGCPLAHLCRTKSDSKTGRKVGHDQFREVRERQVERMQDPEVRKRYSKRQHFGETQFAFIKSHLGIRQFLLRGIEGVQQEWRWTCLAFNMNKILIHVAKLRASSDNEALMASN